MNKGCLFFILIPILIVAGLIGFIIIIVTSFLGALTMQPYIFDVPYSAIITAMDGDGDWARKLAIGKFYFDQWDDYSDSSFRRFCRDYDDGDIEEDLFIVNEILDLNIDEDEEDDEDWEEQLDEETKQELDFLLSQIDETEDFYAACLDDIGEIKTFKTIINGERQEEEVLIRNIEFPIRLGNNYNYTNDFGFERVNNGEQTSHEGNDIFARRGTPVLAMEDGVINKIGWNGLGGWRINMVNSSGSRVYYYAHMNDYADRFKQYFDKPTSNVNIRVNKGDVIGYVGSSGGWFNDTPIGSDTGTDPHVHLQIWVNFKGEEILINPYNILRFIEEVPNLEEAEEEYESNDEDNSGYSRNNDRYDERHNHRQ